ncbi:YfiT family bacillithiol transferase [Roseisolibacter agri]|uniref:Metal-dependent hydrolase n=1 Tax=Roseisolibacter agri TaxID=2014610 RepID=A0AA37VDD9_9BACT|nr:putative metal-dependent hydrolase [Roseisolibacter agri]GLC23504.1 putative metal-dependent hydrolase [Roseisolibacter agri]
MSDDLRYPIGNWSTPADDPAVMTALVDDIAAAPARLRAAISGLDASQLDTPYRDGGWTVRQVVHHVADSHMNAYVRVKKALTEPGTPIAAYEESLWATLPDSRLEPEVSLQLLDALHVRWVTTLRALAPEDWEKTYAHPEMGPVTLRTALGIYAWHGKHHTAHVTGLRERQGW